MIAWILMLLVVLGLFLVNIMAPRMRRGTCEFMPRSVDHPTTG